MQHPTSQHRAWSASFSSKFCNDFSRLPSLAAFSKDEAAFCRTLGESASAATATAAPASGACQAVQHVATQAPQHDPPWSHENRKNNDMPKPMRQLECDPLSQLKTPTPRSIVKGTRTAAASSTFAVPEACVVGVPSAILATAYSPENSSSDFARFGQIPATATQHR